MRIDVKNKKLLIESLSRILNKDIKHQINGISIDSRKIQKNDIFICLKGEQNHGNDFITTELLTKVSLVISDKKSKHCEIYKVKNSKEFLGNLAKEFRLKLKTKFIGITGTNGKTSTKELLAHILKTKFNVSYSKKSYNSTVSLPLSILECDEKSRFCILEMGASKSGEIEYLCDIANPDFGIVTNISKAHLDGFLNFKDLIDTKMSLYDFINKYNGIYFQNKDDKNIVIDDSQSSKIVSFSMFDSNSDYYADISCLEQGNIYINDNLFEMPYTSEIFALNFLSSYSIASTIGISNLEIKKALSDFSIPNGRGNIIEVNNLKIINDTYNANFESMKKGISQLANYYDNRVKIKLVLADMLELSDESDTIHAELGRYINSLDFIDSVYGVGLKIKHTLENINNPLILKRHYKHNKELIDYLETTKIENSVVYLKGSRGMKLEQIIDYLNVK